MYGMKLSQSYNPYSMRKLQTTHRFLRMLYEPVDDAIIWLV